MSEGDRRRRDRDGNRDGNKRDKSTRSKFYPVYGRRPCSFCGSREHYPVNCPVVICVKCNKPGHVAASCVSEPHCWWCSMDGHDQDHCPKRFVRSDENEGRAKPKTSESAQTSAPKSSVAGTSKSAVSTNRPWSSVASGKRVPMVRVAEEPTTISGCVSEFEVLLKKFRGGCAQETLQRTRSVLDEEEAAFEVMVARRRAEFKRRREALEEDERQSQSASEQLPILQQIVDALRQSQSSATGSLNIPSASNIVASSDSKATDVEMPELPVGDSKSEPQLVQNASTSEAVTDASRKTSVDRARSGRSPNVRHPGEARKGRPSYVEPASVSNKFEVLAPDASDEDMDTDAEADALHSDLSGSRAAADEEERSPHSEVD